MRTAIFFALVAALAIAGCGDDEGFPADPDAAVIPVDADPTPDADPLNPMTLRDTGLYSDFENEVLAPGVIEYQPEYELWSDAATKLRWIQLPDGAQIDTSDMDFWNYPVDTKSWKEFRRDGVRVETRLLWKQGPDPADWFLMAYAWNADQTEAVAARQGATDVLGTNHDIPRQGDCRKCHERMPDFLLGFSAFQLDHDLGGLNLGDLVADSRLTDPPAGSLPVPGDNQIQVDAFGYIHSNCGGCHHENSDVMDTTNLNLRLHVSEVGGAGDATAIHTTTVNQPKLLSQPDTAVSLVVPMSPDTSAVSLRMKSRDGSMVDMPPEGTEEVDAAGTAAVDAWINSLTP